MLFVWIWSDWLLPPGEVRAAAKTAKEAGVRARYAEIESLSGHDSFLKDWAELREAIGPFLES